MSATILNRNAHHPANEGAYDYAAGNVEGNRDSSSEITVVAVTDGSGIEYCPYNPAD
jgi:hypothetical protein